MKKGFVFSLLLLLLTAPVWSAELRQCPPVTFDETGLAPMFPFNIKNGFPANITNIQTWEKSPVAGADGLMTIRGRHFTNDKGPVRFLGTNFCFSASFPDKKDAPEVARSLARFGINLVRLHHMDSRDIWGNNLKKSTTLIDPEQLDKLDFLISEFKKNGIYVNINLHVSRTFSKNDGFINTERLPRMDKGIDNIDRKMIELQKKYAKDLLTHVNPYTKTAYINEPAVAMIELNNENSIISSWRSAALDNLPDPYSTHFRQLWNSWLLKKYGTVEKMLAGWGGDKELPTLGKNLIKDGKFPVEKGQKWTSRTWLLQTDNTSKTEYTFTESRDPRFEGANILSVKISKMGNVNWIPQIYHTNIKFEKNKIYTLSFWVRSKEGNSKIESIRTSVGMNHEPWQNLGLASSVPVTNQWTQHEFVFRARDNDNNARFAFSGFDLGTIEFANVALKEGCKIDRPQKDDLKNALIPVPKSSDLSTLFRIAPKALDDWAEFIVQTENDYFQEMYRYVKEELKARQPISGTQFNYGARYVQSRLDYTDIHSYWNHPNFPNKSWDRNDWYLGQRAVVDVMGNWSTITSLAEARVTDRAYTVSEYDHPTPNFYAAEGYPILASMAAFQDWSGLMQFAWSHSKLPDNNAIPTFFDMRSNPVKRLHLPACYAMFVRKDVQAGPGNYVYTPEMTEKDDIDELATRFKKISLPVNRDKTLSMAIFTGLELTDLNNRTSSSKKVQKIESWSDLPDTFGSPEKNWVRNEFKELFWSFEKEKAGFFKVDTAGTKFFTGFVKGRSFDYNGMKLSIGKTRLDWATISLVRTKPVAKKSTADRLEKGQWLFAANGFTANTNQVTVSPKEGYVSTARDYGGNSGTAPALAEGVPCSLVLNNIEPDAVSAFALDEDGNRKAPLKVLKDEAGTKIEFGPRYKTLWYELNIK